MSSYVNGGNPTRASTVADSQTIHTTCQSQPEVQPTTKSSISGQTAPSSPEDLHRQSVSSSSIKLKSAAPSRPRKPRRTRPRIELAPDQPPTSKGAPRARVYVACLQCRTRKIRCDGAKPACYNCSKRIIEQSECDYDATPKRRGPNRIPDKRHRLHSDVDVDEEGPVRRRRRARATTTSAPPGEHTSPEPVHDNIAESILLSPLDSLYLPDPKFSHPVGTVAPPTTVIGDHSFDFISLISSKPESGHELLSQADDDLDSYAPGISYEPSVNFSRKIWWDYLLSLYTFPHSGNPPTLTTSQRETAARGITSNIRLIFRESLHFFSFFHISTFLSNYQDPAKRGRIQPSLIFALLATAIFWQSSEVDLGYEGRKRALRFRDEAQSALDASLNAGWIDVALAQAAWLLAMFEVCAHPRQSPGRQRSSLVILDSIIRSLSLTAMDADRPKTSVFLPGTVAVVETNRRFPGQSPANHDGMDSACSCQIMTLGASDPESSAYTPLWSCTPAWSKPWSEGEIMKESCRRLSWSSTMIAAGYASHTVAHKSPALDLFISDPPNHANFFSGEIIADDLDLSSPGSPKDTIWALHDRAVLLWLSCVRMRNDPGLTDFERAQFALKTWLEADALESSLNKHTCGLENAFLSYGREYLFNTRMCVSYEFQRYIPLASSPVRRLFYRDMAKEWLTLQGNVAKRYMVGLRTVTRHSSITLTRCPTYLFWFMGQIAWALSLLEWDNTLTIAIDVCKALLPSVDYLTVLWPCPEQRAQYGVLLERLNDACHIAGVRPPPPSHILPLPASVTLAQPLSS